ncbi:MAG: ABC-2 family transporter protein [Clostridiales bacterium]|nr:ABC-2 family transporter protein [Clostridiales bacterium]
MSQKVIVDTMIKKSVIYRGNFIANTVFSLFPLAVQFFLWKAIFVSSSNGEISGFTFNTVILYFIMVLIFNEATNPRQIARSVSDDILSGQLNNHLLKPVSYFRMKFIEHFANRLTSLSVLLPVIAVAVVIIYNVNFSLLNITFFTIFLAITFIFNFFIYMILAITVFWSEESSNLMDLWRQVGGVLSGAYFPLSLLPFAVSKYVLLLPFKYTTYYPIAIILNGKATFNEMLMATLVYSIWTIVLYSLVKIIWNKGILKYSAYGM